MNLGSLSILIPAAGASQRLGQPKQTVLYKGEPLIQRAIETAESLTPREIIVVTGANADSVKKVVQKTSAHCVHNPDWAGGMGGSIAVGASTVDKHSNGLMILLCDQWGIQPQDLQQLARTWISDTDRIVCAETAGRPGPPRLGPPVIFPLSCFAALCGLQGDQGARSILAAYPRLLSAVPIKNAASDLNTPAQLNALNQDF